MGTHQQSWWFTDRNEIAFAELIEQLQKTLKEREMVMA